MINWKVAFSLQNTICKKHSPKEHQKAIRQTSQ